MGDTQIVILAGGKSTRFGSNKAKASWGNKTILENIIDKLEKVTDDIAISVGEKDLYPEIGLKKIFDVKPGLGPLGGLYSCLKTVKKNRIMLVACDMPLIDPNFIYYLLSIKTWAPIVVPYTKRGYEPLHAIYHRGLLPIIEHLIEKKRLKMIHLLEMVPIRKITKKDLKHAFNSDLIFSNINTKEEYFRLSKFAK